MCPSWFNWSGSVASRPQTIATPTTEAELAAIMHKAAKRGQQIRVVGTGHSFVPLCAADDLLISLDHLQGLISADSEEQTATFWAGTKLYAVGEPLWEYGLALANMGDIDRQSLGGAIGTGTHGTGPTLGNLSTQVVGLRLLTSAGEVIDCSPTHEPEIFRAAQLSLGALGIITQVTLRCLPAYYLRERTWVATYDECVAALDAHIAATRHFEFFWVPGEDLCAMKALQPVDPSEETPDEVVPVRKPVSARLSRYLNPPRIDRSYRIFPASRDRKFNETEFALPAAHGPSCLHEVRELMQTRYHDVAWPIEYRTLAADTIPLSPAYDRETVTISVHQAADLPYQPFFEAVEAIFCNHQGRPHWGKLHTHQAGELATLYSEWNAFQAVRAQLDPDGRMLNPYLRELLLPAK